MLTINNMPKQLFWSKLQKCFLQKFWFSKECYLIVQYFVINLEKLQCLLLTVMIFKWYWSKFWTLPYPFIWPVTIILFISTKLAQIWHWKYRNIWYINFLIQLLVVATPIQTPVNDIKSINEDLFQIFLTLFIV